MKLNEVKGIILDGFSVSKTNLIVRVGVVEGGCEMLETSGAVSGLVGDLGAIDTIYVDLPDVRSAIKEIACDCQE